MQNWRFGLANAWEVCKSTPENIDTVDISILDLSTVSVFSGVDLQTSHAFASPNRYFCNSSKSAPLPHGCRGDPSKLCNCQLFQIKDIVNRSKSDPKIDPKINPKSIQDWFPIWGRLGRLKSEDLFCRIIIYGNPGAF